MYTAFIWNQRKKKKRTFFSKGGNNNEGLRRKWIWNPGNFSTTEIISKKISDHQKKHRLVFGIKTFFPLSMYWYGIELTLILLTQSPAQKGTIRKIQINTGFHSILVIQLKLSLIGWSNFSSCWYFSWLKV